VATNEDGAFWTIIAYLISGLGFWGGLGYLGDRYLKTDFLTVVGMLFGLVTGLYLVWIKMVKENPPK
jgi:F0F1-type ATP synthase assembly protein I